MMMTMMVFKAREPVGDGRHTEHDTNIRSGARHGAVRAALQRFRAQRARAQLLVAASDASERGGEQQLALRGRVGRVHVESVSESRRVLGAQRRRRRLQVRLHVHQLRGTALRKTYQSMILTLTQSFCF